jgi:ADP-heptose:LPS heptosyltransferase
MKEVRVLHSLPGDWMDRHGWPQPRFIIRRIAVLKPDHIGDLLVVDRAFAQLRQFFPEARIELICGTWNVALARRLGRCDAVHGINLFHEVSGQQQDPEIADALRRRGAEALQALRLGPFDLAIDLRYDLDSRPLLKNIDARIYAGFGTRSQFPFLDVVLPMHHAGEAGGARRIVLVGRDLFAPGLSGPSPLGEGGGELSAQRQDLVLDFEIEGAVSPKELGTAPDERRLGIGLERVALGFVEHADEEVGEETLQDVQPVFHSGWSGMEPWGCWSLGQKARLVIALPSRIERPLLRLRLRLRAHVTPSNRRVVARVAAGGERQTEEIAWEYPAGPRVLDLVVPARVPRVALISAPFSLAPGRYSGVLRLYLPQPPAGAAHFLLELRSTQGNAALAQRGFTASPRDRGLIQVPFDCEVDVSEQVRLRVTAENADMLRGARVESVALDQEEAHGTRVPVTHMGHWASLLVLRVAQIFSDEAPFRGSLADSRARLCSRERLAELPVEVQDIRDRIDDWQHAGHVVVGVALGCNTSIRKWPLLFYVETLRQLLLLGRVQVLFIGSPADREESERACLQLDLDPERHVICGASRLEDLGFLLENLDLFLGNNTGTTHFAGMSGVRTIGIYAGTNHPREWGPVGENSSWIMREEPCAPCYLANIKDCRFWHSCMVNLLPDDVLRIVLPEVRAILSRRERTLIVQDAAPLPDTAAEEPPPEMAAEAWAAVDADAPPAAESPSASESLAPAVEVEAAMEAARAAAAGAKPDPADAEPEPGSEPTAPAEAAGGEAPRAARRVRRPRASGRSPASAR